MEPRRGKSLVPVREDPEGGGSLVGQLNRPGHRDQPAVTPGLDLARCRKFS